MTAVLFEKKNGRYLMRAEYHTDPTVCAGISAIIQALAGYCMNHDDGITDLDVRLEPGDSLVSFRGDGCTQAFEMAYIGIKQIEAGYPDSVIIIDNYMGTER